MFERDRVTLCAKIFMNSVLFFAIASETLAVTVISTSSNTTVHCDRDRQELEDNDCGIALPQEFCFMLEWRDADYDSSGPSYGNWEATDPGATDGSPTEVWIRNGGDSISTCTTVPSMAVSIHLTGDNNDGHARILVDDVEVAQLDMWTNSPPEDNCRVHVTGLVNTTHLIKVESLGESPSNPPHDDVAVLGAAACSMDQVCFFCDPPTAEFPDDGWTGHSFLQLLTHGGPNGCDRRLAWGYYPEFTSPIAPGTFYNDSSRPWTTRICFPINPSQWHAIADAISEDFLNPPRYNVFTNNCQHWNIDIAAVVGFDLPRLFPELAYPEEFCLALGLVGEPNTYDGGTVDNNNCSTAPNGEAQIATDSPLDFNYPTLERAAHAEPALLASSLMMLSDIQVLGTFTVQTGDALVIDLTCTTPGDPNCISLSNAFMSMDWGDGSSFDQQALSFAHTYASLGVYPAALVIIDAGAVRNYTLTIDVFALATTDAVIVPIPPAVQGGGSNPGEDPILPLPPNVIPAISEWGMILLSLALLTVGLILIQIRRRTKSS